MTKMDQFSGKKFVIPKKSQDKIKSVLKDLESDSDSDMNSDPIVTENGSKHSSSSHKHKHSERERDSRKNHHSDKKDRDKYNHKDKYDSDHSSSKHKSSDSHRDKTDKHRDGDKHRSESSSDKHRHSESKYKDRDRHDKTDKSRHEHSSSSSKKQNTHDRERTKKVDDTLSNNGYSDKANSSRAKSESSSAKADSSSARADSSSAKSEKSRSSSHGSGTKSSSHSSSSSNSHKHSSSSKHSDHKSEKHKSSHSSQGSDKHSSSKHQSSSKQSESRSSGSHSKSSNSDSHSKSSSSQKHSSHSEKSSKHSSSSKDKSKSKDLSLDELRDQVQRMKAMEAQIESSDGKSATGEKVQTDKPSVPAKSRQGVELDAEQKKTQILSRTQMILERTKAKLAQAKENEKQPKKRLGKRHTDDKGHGTSSDKVIKSKSVIKDEISDSSDEDELNVSFENPLMENLVRPEAGELLKDIKKKIDEKLGNYNFPDRPVKEKELKKKYLEKAKKLKEKGRDKIKDCSKDIRDKHKDQIKRIKDKREKIKEMMRSDYQNNFSEAKPMVKKPVIVRRHQNAPPPMNFEDLMKLAEQKCKETAPIPKIQPKKPEDRPQTQEEIDRRRREKESRERKKLEAEGHSPASSSQTNNSVNKMTKLTSDQQTKPSANSGVKQKDKYDTVNENVLNCKPSSKSTRPQPESTNPWDRIYGQIQKNNPKMEKRKRQAIESSDEEESDYDLDDDFIDDGDDGMDISSHIRNIFGYDKSRYKDDDDDVDNMEANFATVMREEARSAKIGKMEDLEDMRREEEELKRKQQAKKLKYR